MNEQETKCKKLVFDRTGIGQYRPHECGKGVSVREKDGSWWCKVHSPTMKAERAAKRKARKAKQDDK